METRGNLSLRQVLQIQQHKQLLLSDGEKADQLPQQQSLTDNGLRGYCIAGLATIAFPDILFVAVLFWVAGMSPVFAALPESIIECQPYALLQEGRPIAEAMTDAGLFTGMQAKLVRFGAAAGQRAA